MQRGFGFFDTHQRDPGFTSARLEKRHEHAEGPQRPVRHVRGKKAPWIGAHDLLAELQRLLGSKTLHVHTAYAWHDIRQVFFNRLPDGRGLLAQVLIDTCDISAFPPEYAKRVGRLQLAYPFRV